MDAHERMKVHGKLVGQGVGVMDADRLTQACVTDAELVLTLVPLAAAPRVGDRIRVKFPAPSGERSLLIEDVGEGFAQSKGGKLWAIVGRPVESGRRDDVSLGLPVRRS